jgi:hypothetical protein
MKSNERRMSSAPFGTRGFSPGEYRPLLERLGLGAG